MGHGRWCPRHRSPRSALHVRPIGASSPTYPVFVLPISLNSSPGGVLNQDMDVPAQTQATAGYMDVAASPHSAAAGFDDDDEEVV